MNRFGVNTKVFIGKYNIEKDFGDFKRVFIVTDRYMVESGNISYITDQLVNAEYEIFSEITPDPDISVITEGVEKIKNFLPNVVIAFGGGSPIDAAKAIVFFATKVFGIKDCPFIAIPTTSGTGSEVTKFAVISDKEKGIKYPLVDEKLLPDIAILDCSLVISVPPTVTAYTGLDVITHAIEAFMSSCANDFSDALAEKAFALAFENLKTAYKEPDNKNARQSLHNASCLAGMAFNNAGLGLNHSMAHILGARAKLPHGLANAILLPHVIEFNAGCEQGGNNKLLETAHKYEILASLIGMKATSTRQSVINLIREIKMLCKSMNIPKSIEKCGFNKKDFYDNLDEMCEIALVDGCTQTNSRSVNSADIKGIFIRAFK